MSSALTHGCGPHLNLAARWRFTGAASILAPSPGRDRTVPLCRRPMKQRLAFSGNLAASVVSDPERQIGVDRFHGSAVQACAPAPRPRRTHDGNVHRRAFVDPWPVAPRHEDVAGFGHALEHLAIGSAANALRGDQSHGAHLLALDHRARLLKPIGDQIGLGGHAIFIELEQSIHIRVAQVAPQHLAAQKRRIADDEIDFGPGRLAGVSVRSRAWACRRRRAR